MKASVYIKGLAIITCGSEGFETYNLGGRWDLRAEEMVA